MSRGGVKPHSADATPTFANTFQGLCVPGRREAAQRPRRVGGAKAAGELLAAQRLQAQGAARGRLFGEPELGGNDGRRGLQQQAAVRGEATGGGGVAGVEQRLVEGAGGVAIERVGLGGVAEVADGLDGTLDSSQGAAQRRPRDGQVGPCGDGLVVVDEVIGQPGEEVVQPPAEQTALGVGLAGRVAGVVPGGPLPLDAEMVIPGREMSGIESSRLAPRDEASASSRLAPRDEASASGPFAVQLTQGAAGDLHGERVLPDADRGFDEVQGGDEVVRVGG